MLWVGACLCQVLNVWKDLSFLTAGWETTVTVVFFFFRRWTRKYVELCPPSRAWLSPSLARLAVLPCMRPFSRADVLMFPFGEGREVAHGASALHWDLYVVSDYW